MDSNRQIVIRKIGEKVGNIAIVPINAMPEIKSYTDVNIKFGSRLVKVTLIPKFDNEELFIGEKAFDELGVYEGMEAEVRVHDNNIHIGPLVGIFVNKGTTRRISEGCPTNRIVQTVTGAKSAKTPVYFFSIDDINWPKGEIRGFSYSFDTNKWTRNNYPLPDVLIDRGGGFLPHQKIEARYIRKQIDQVDGLLKLNSRHTFNKWDLHYNLSKHKKMVPYLPDTCHYVNTDNLEKMIEKYPVLYLKSCDGSNGKGVMRVKRVYYNKYEYNYFDDKVTIGYEENLSSIYKVAKKFLKVNDCIIQQGIDVINYNGNNVDMRVLAQKSSAGKWRITSMPVRIASGGCAITSTKSGSSVYPYEVAMEKVLHYLPQEIADIKRDIIDMVFLSIQCIEKEYGIFGELGIDVAIDKQNNVWFIEANAKPGKDTIMIAGPQNDIDLAFSRPFYYSRYISGFPAEIDY